MNQRSHEDEHHRVVATVAAATAVGGSAVVPSFNVKKHIISFQAMDETRKELNSLASRLPLVAAEDEDVYESLPSNVGVKTHMMAGAAAGVLEHCVMYPVDVIKTRMQSLNPNPKAVYRNVFQGLTTMIRQEGLVKSMKGVNIMVVGAGPAHAMYFACYEKMKRVLSGTENGAGSPLAQAAAGCLATVLHDAVMNPADVIKQRLQMYNSPYATVLQCAGDTWRREGLKAFYRSYGTQLAMNVPFQVLHFVTYEKMQELTNPDRLYSPVMHMASGAVAGGFASAITTPLDVCKTLLNTQEAQTLNVSKQTQISGLLNAVKTVYSCCGFRGYFQGLQARVMFSLPSTAISWSVYEFIKHVLSEQNIASSKVFSETTTLPPPSSQNEEAGYRASKWDMISPSPSTTSSSKGADISDIVDDNELRPVHRESNLN